MPNHYDFEGRAALVTGGASGIGAAVVERLGAGGAAVHVFDLANGDDVRDSSQLNAAVERLPRLDILVCCAGIGGDSLHTEDVSDEEWERVHAINLNGVFYANRAAIPKMKANGYGRIVNVASIAGFTGYSGLSVYSATKASLIGFTHSLAREVGRRGVNVNAVAPGFLETEMTRGLDEERREQVARRSALRRLPDVCDAADAVEFLLGPKARSITGTVLTVDAGSTA